MTEEATYQQLVKGLLLLIGGLLFVRFFPALWGTFAFGGLILLLGVAGLLAYRAYRRSGAATVEENEFIRRIRARIEDCRVKADDFREEAATISRSRRELLDQLERTKAASPAARKKGEALLTELDEEQALRLGKAHFFEVSITKLEALLEQHKLHEALLAKEEQLEKLREVNYDDLAEMENLRYQLDQDRVRLDTILELTHRADVSPTLNATEQLRLSLLELDQPGP